MHRLFELVSLLDRLLYSEDALLHSDVYFLQRRQRFGRCCYCAVLYYA